MAVLVKRFRVRFNGMTYGPGQPGGQIIEGLSDEEEARLIASSGGTIEKYVYPLVQQDTVDAENKDAGASENDAGDAKESGSPGSETGEEKIINIDPGDLIQPGNDSKAKKKGR